MLSGYRYKFSHISQPHFNFRSLPEHVPPNNLRIFRNILNLKNQISNYSIPALYINSYHIDSSKLKHNIWFFFSFFSNIQRRNWKQNKLMAHKSNSIPSFSQSF